MISNPLISKPLISKPLISKLSIIVIHYNVPHLLKECLVRLQRYCNEAEIIVVDTDLKTETKRFLEKDFSNVQLITTENYSMAHAANVGLEKATRPYIAHMNADVLINHNTFSDLLDVLQQENVAMVGPQSLTALGVPQDQGVLYKRFHLNLNWKLHLNLYWKLQRKLQDKKSVEVTWLSGCLQLIKRELLDTIGPLNRDLRFYNEDMEWCWRARKAGYQLRLVNTQVLHYGGSSTPKNPLLLIEGYRGGFKLSQQYRSQAFQKLHYWLVRFESMLKKYLALNSFTRRTYSGIHWLFKEHRFDESPFTESLNEANPNWPKF